MLRPLIASLLCAAVSPFHAPRRAALTPLTVRVESAADFSERPSLARRLAGAAVSGAKQAGILAT
eukprot:CAMPEP_0119259700 /NCGR_PEP_ID=MMETSP1329-20130426/417_1 /TAXON_ID=114041 /ORGANISM="Genus nov. species nov., Strain RCC1024" /LENGTH=64 /DNA_ID=CAMNT_0007259099 /DNA_START=145 /DNA_END=335 /DNA_ORIENTATION=+